MRPFFKWFGSKWQMSARLPPPVHDTIIEPFAGSAGYATRHGGTKQVILFEMNPTLVSLWHFLINASQTDILDIPVGLPIGTDIRSLDLSEMQKALLQSWQRTGNNSYSCWHTSKWGHLPGFWTQETRARIVSQLPQIRHWLVFDGDAFVGSRAVTKRRATWVIDPPYQHNHGYGTPKLDYPHLGVRCQKLPGQVIVHEGVGPKGERPNWLPFREVQSTASMRRQPGKTELVWTNADLTQL